MSADAKSYVITPPPQAAIAVAGTRQDVSRCAASGASAAITRSTSARWATTCATRRSSSPSRPTPIVPDGATVPYPPLTKDMHHEVELVVALKSGGRNIKLEQALDCIWGYGVGIDLTRRDLQIASRDMKRPWEIGKAFDASAPCGPLQPASKIGHPSKGRIALKVNGKVRQDGDLAQMIWNVPEVIVKLSRDGRARGRRHHHDRDALGRGRRRSPATSSNARSRASAS